MTAFFFCFKDHEQSEWARQAGEGHERYYWKVEVSNLTQPYSA